MSNTDRGPEDSGKRRLRAEVERLGALYRLTDALGRAGHLPEIYNEAFDCVQRCIGAERAAILLGEGASALRFVASRGLSDSWRQAVEAHAPWSKAPREPTPVVVGDVEASVELAPWRDLFEAERIRAYAFLPLASGGEVLGAFMIFFSDAHALHGEELALARTVAGHVAFAVEKQRAADAVRHARDQLEAVFRDLSDGVTVLSPTGALLYANAAAARLAGVSSPAELLATPTDAVLARTEVFDEAGAPLPVDRSPGFVALQQQREARALLRLRRVDTREERFCDVRSTPVFDDGVGLRFVVNVLRDVTEERRRQEERERIARFQEQLLGIVGHDLRGPITAIRLAASTVLARAQVDEKQRRAAARIVGSAERAERMIADLLDFTRARMGGGIEIARAPADMHALARASVEEVQDQYPDRAVQLVHEGEASGWWDADRIAQVLQNLLDNALQYGPPDLPVRLAVRGEPDAVVLTMHNRGPAIPAEHLPKLFHPFKRVVAPGFKRPKSVGLGLFIVSEIVRAHGGSVEAASSEQDGTTFTVRLPRR